MPVGVERRVFLPPGRDYRPHNRSSDSDDGQDLDWRLVLWVGLGCRGRREPCRETYELENLGVPCQWQWARNRDSELSLNLNGCESVTRITVGSQKSGTGHTGSISNDRKDVKPQQGVEQQQLEPPAILKTWNLLLIISGTSALTIFFKYMNSYLNS